jgi:hypothetical protein
MPQLFGFIMAVIGAILFMRWLSRQQVVISKTLDQVAKARARAKANANASQEPSKSGAADSGKVSQPVRQIETLEEGADGVFRPTEEDPPRRD